MMYMDISSTRLFLKKYIMSEMRTGLKVAWQSDIAQPSYWYRPTLYVVSK